MRAIVASAPLFGIEIAGPDGEPATQAETDDDSIAFNGVGEESHEAFAWPPDLTGRWPDGDFVLQRDRLGYAFDFCKTQWKPYDAAVTACLLAAKRHLGDDVLLSSDGELDEWEAGRSLYRAAIGDEPPIPWSPEERGFWAEEGDDDQENE